MLEICDGGHAGLPSAGRPRPQWLVIRGVASGGFSHPRSPPLLRGEEFILHPLEALGRIAGVVEATAYY